MFATSFHRLSSDDTHTPRHQGKTQANKAAEMQLCRSTNPNTGKNHGKCRERRPCTARPPRKRDGVFAEPTQDTNLETIQTHTTVKPDKRQAPHLVSQPATTNDPPKRCRSQPPNRSTQSDDGEPVLEPSPRYRANPFLNLWETELNPLKRVDRTRPLCTGSRRGGPRPHRAR